MPAKLLRRDPRIDAYIANSADFARPILVHLRKTLHSASPQITETLKWGRPHFLYNGILCGMSAFKQHCAFGFWKGSLLVAADKNQNRSGMGQFGRLTSIKDLPPRKQIVTYVRAAMKLNDDGVKSPMMSNRKARKPLPVPFDLNAALKRNKSARTTFDNFSPSQRREYVQWITEAKGDDTRARRLATTIEWLTEGKQRNWQYMSKKQ